MSQIRDLDRAHVLHPWSTQSKVTSPVIARASGALLWDEDGREYMDFMSQLCNVNVGHGDPRIVEAIKTAADDLIYTAPTFLNRPQSTLARRLAEVTPGDLNRSFFTTSGSEANESAIQLARLVTGREKIISRYRSYHGATYAAHTLSGGKLRLHAGPGIPGVIHALEQYCYRCPFGQSYPGCGIECASQFEHLFELEGPDLIAAVIVEPIAHNDGVLVPPPEYLARLRELCDRHGVLLIFDEVLTGFGRTGRWFAADHWSVVPDMMTIGKGLTSGYAALGAVVIREEVARYFDDHPIPFGFTNSGMPMAFSIANAVIDVLVDDDLVAEADRKGRILSAGLEVLRDRHPIIGDIRGRGLMYGVELVTDRISKAPLTATLAGLTAGTIDALTPLRARMPELGLLLQVRGNVLRFYPPLVISEAQIGRALDIVDDALSLVRPEALSASR